MKLTLRIHRQDGPDAKPFVEDHVVDGLEPHMSILDVLDLLNVQLIESGRDPIAVEYDCREGICGACGITVNGRPHGPQPNTPSCHQRLAGFQDGQTVELEPLRSAAYPVIRDLIVDRSSLDRIISLAGNVAVDAGTAPDADALPVGTDVAEKALDMAACLGCGACVAACPNGAAHLYAGSKLEHLALLPNGSQQRDQRARTVGKLLDDDFGPCSLYGACAEVCPASIPLSVVAAVPKHRLRAMFKGKIR